MSKGLKYQGLYFTIFSVKRCEHFILKTIKQFPRSVQDNVFIGGGEI